MSYRRLATRSAVLVLAFIPLTLLVGCARGLPQSSPLSSAVEPSSTPLDAAASAPVSVEDRVIVRFEDRPAEFDPSAMDLLLDTELKADDALTAAGAGWIDGNDVGAYEYELYFVGDDADVMWKILEPVFADAPIPWTHVELHHGRDDPSPRVLTPKEPA